MSKVIENYGKVVIIDLIKHEHINFRDEMKDYHLGFFMEEIAKIGRKYFNEVSVKELQALCKCDASGLEARLFELMLHDPKSK
jgi:hypothetical protein